MSATIFIEGAATGPKSKYLQVRCREGFHKLLTKSELARPPALRACGGRGNAFKLFSTAHAKAANGEYVALLVDSEDPVTNIEHTWRHLKARDNWDMPTGATDEQVLLMTTCMETWIAADRQALKSHYGANLHENALPDLHDMESRHRHNVQDALMHATRDCKNAYQKGKRSFEVLEQLQPEELRKRLPSYARCERLLKKYLNSPPAIHDLLQGLQPNQQRGSKPRCHLLLHGNRAMVAESLNSLLQPYGMVTETDVWFPDGFNNVTEPTLGETPGLLSDAQRATVTDWWLAVHLHANTPNWDMAGTCTIAGKRGLFLVEAKAHANELKPDGKSAPKTENGFANHERIHAAIEQANVALNENTIGWGLTRDSHYQLSNRFAWSWKIASLGVPVILVYLGFLHANEMRDQGPPFESEEEWNNVVHTHSDGIVPTGTWNEWSYVNGTPLIPLIRSLHLDLHL